MIPTARRGALNVLILASLCLILKTECFSPFAHRRLTLSRLSETPLRRTSIASRSQTDPNQGLTATLEDEDGNKVEIEADYPEFSGEHVNGNYKSPEPLPWLKGLQDSIFLGIPPTFEIVAIMAIYFVEGAHQLAQLAQTFLLKDELQLGPAEASALAGVFVLPWTIKPLYGFLSDGVPIFGSRRRSYLIICGIFGFMADMMIGVDFFDAFHGNQGLILKATIGSILVSRACIAFSDVVGDGIVVQRTRDSDDPKVAGGLQSLCWGSAAAGGLLSAYFSGSLLEIMTPRNVFAITAFFQLLITFIGLLIDEQPSSNDTTSTTENPVLEQAKSLWSAFQQPSIWRPALFMFLWQSTPTSQSAFTYFVTNDLGLSAEFLGRATFLSNVASLLGVWLYQEYLRTVPIKDIFFWLTILSTPLGMISLLLITHANRSLGIPDGAFIFGDDVILSILGEIGFLPTLVLAARLCPPGIEAVLFATLMSIFNASSTVGAEIGAILTKYLGVTDSNFDNLALLTFICNLSSIYPVFFIGWLDQVGSQSEEEYEQQNEENTL